MCWETGNGKQKKALANSANEMLITVSGFNCESEQPWKLTIFVFNQYVFTDFLEREEDR